MHARVKFELIQAQHASAKSQHDQSYRRPTRTKLLAFTDLFWRCHGDRVISGMLWLGIALHSLLVLALVLVAGHSSVFGFSYIEIKSAIIAGIQKGLGAIFIFFLIGILVAALI